MISSSLLTCSLIVCPVGDCFISSNSIEKESLICIYVYSCFLGSDILQVIA